MASFASFTLFTLWVVPQPAFRFSLSCVILPIGCPPFFLYVLDYQTAKNLFCCCLQGEALCRTVRSLCSLALYPPGENLARGSRLLYLLSFCICDCLSIRLPLVLLVLAPSTLCSRFGRNQFAICSSPCLSFFYCSVGSAVGSDWITHTEFFGGRQS